MIIKRGKCRSNISRGGKEKRIMFQSSNKSRVKRSSKLVGRMTSGYELGRCRRRQQLSLYRDKFVRQLERLAKDRHNHVTAVTLD